MKRVLTCIFSVMTFTTVFADINVDSLLLAQTDEPATQSEAMEMLGISPLESPDINNTQQLETYINWAGEECLAEQPGNTHAHPYYNWRRDITYAGIPIFLSAFIIKGQKKAFRSTRFTFEKNFKTEIDNYTQFLPYAALLGMKASGYEGRSSWDRMLVSTLASNAVMALAVNATKYSVKEMRPDNSSENSFPSGHTATAFVAATVFHKEYGLTRSPWYSVAGYGVATATGVMRVLNNRHWISDIIAGAGIGIMSTELGYWVGDLIYKEKGIRRYELDNYTDPNHPSFFDIQMGVASHSNSISFQYADDNKDEGIMYPNETIKLGTSSVVGVEGAYFFNKYFGIGGMMRVTTTPTKNTALTTDEKTDWNRINEELEKLNCPGIYRITLENNNFMDVSLDAGIYGNLPISNRFSIGAKFLAGTRLSGGISYQAQNGFRMPYRIDGIQIYSYDEIYGLQPKYMFENPDGSTFASNERETPGVSLEYNYVLDDNHPWTRDGKSVSEEYDILKVNGSNSFNYVFGISFSYRYKNNFAWKIFADFDSAKNDYNAVVHYLSDELKERNISGVFDDIELDYDVQTSKRLNFWTFGGAFSINF